MNPTSPRLTIISLTRQITFGERLLTYPPPLQLGDAIFFIYIASLKFIRALVARNASSQIFVSSSFFQRHPLCYKRLLSRRTQFFFFLPYDKDKKDHNQKYPRKRPITQPSPKYHVLSLKS